MGRYRYEKKPHNKLPPFVPLLVQTLDCAAWRALSHGARSLYVALRRRFSSISHNNGRLFLSQRKAAIEIGSHHNEIARWFRELQHYGFIVCTSPGCLGVEGKGKAPHWRLAELGYMNDPPTRDFLKWEGQKFSDKKAESRAGNGARGVPGMAHTAVPENQPLSTESVPEMAHIYSAATVPEKAHISNKPLPLSPEAADGDRAAIAAAENYQASGYRG